MDVHSMVERAAAMELLDMRLRFPRAVRPWQHVLVPLAGCLRLAEQLCIPCGAGFAKVWDCGPDGSGDATVGESAETTAWLWDAGARMECTPFAERPREAGLLRRDSTLARSEPGWKPRCSPEQARARTVTWYQAWTRGAEMAAIGLGEIRAYVAAGKS